MANGITHTSAPPPPPGNGRPKGPSGLCATALVALEVGHGLEIENPAHRSTWSASASYWGRKLGRKFVTRGIPGRGFGIYRVE